MIAANLLVCLAAALVGKAIGVLRARWQLACLNWAVAGHLDDQEENASALAIPSAPRGERFAMHNRPASSLGRASIY